LPKKLILESNKGKIEITTTFSIAAKFRAKLLPKRLKKFQKQFCSKFLENPPTILSKKCKLTPKYGKIIFRFQQGIQLFFGHFFHCLPFTLAQIGINQYN
jgi:hypothetical protein